MSQPATSQRSEDLLPVSLMPSVEMIQNADSETLKTAFDTFNELSLQLVHSYENLEKRVADLSSELDTVSEQRIQELQQKEQLANRLQTLISCLPGGVIVLDNRGIVVEANPVADTLLGIPLQSRRWRDIISSCFVPRMDDGHEVSTREGRRISLTTRSLGEDGQIILLTDQTETRRLQAEQSRNERLSALGKMVSTLAHQVRTPLSSAMLYANHLCNAQLKLDKRQEFTHKLLNRLHYMERQVRDMLLFVKGDIPLTDTVSVSQLQELLNEAIEMPLKAHHATCHWLVSNDDCLIRCNSDALIGALLNLVNNSLQAVSKAEITIKLSVSENNLIISISDNGPGLAAPEEQLEEMFFTTKEQGTGIGLSVVRVVAQSHGGDFLLSNLPTGGCCARVTLPIFKSE